MKIVYCESTVYATLLNILKAVLDFVMLCSIAVNSDPSHIFLGREVVCSRRDPCSQTTIHPLLTTTTSPNFST